MDSTKVVGSIRQTFIDQDKYQFDKHVPEFKVDGKYLGDCYIQTAFEPRGDKPPRFYNNFSPFDLISGKSPDRATVYENGELLLDVDFTDDVVTRTGAMDTVLLDAFGIKSLKDKKIIMFGTGKVAKRSVKILKDTWSDLTAIDCVTRSNDLAGMNKYGSEIGVKVNEGSIDRLEQYDIIICHTNTAETFLTKEHINKIKKGAIVHTFISSTVHGEVADEFYDSDKANIVVDWDQTLKSAQDLARATEAGLAKDQDIVRLKDLLDGSKTLDNTKDYTIYRSMGTPIQNLAMLKLKIS